MLVQPPARRPDVSLYRLGTEPVFFDRAQSMDPQTRKTKCRLNTLLTPNPSCECQGRSRLLRRPAPNANRPDPCNKVALCTNSKKPRYSGSFSCEMPRCGRSQERSKDHVPSIVLTWISQKPSPSSSRAYSPRPWQTVLCR